MSQTSQSSIEVLLRDCNDSRKPSEERRFAQIVDSDALKAATTKEEEVDDAMTTSAMKQSEEIVKQKAILAIGSVNLTESSSSGSICESVVTAYDKSERQKSLGKKSSDAGLDGIFSSSQNLLKKTPKQKHDSTSYGFTPIQYNYDDLSIVVSFDYFSSENQNLIIFSSGSSFEALLVPTSLRGE